MIDGLWGLTFTVADNTGGGVVYVREGQAFGGDAGFTYVGRLSQTGNSVSGKLEITQFNPNFLQLIPGLTRYALEVHGESDGKTFHLTGHLINRPGAPAIIIIGVKQTDA